MCRTEPGPNVVIRTALEARGKELEAEVAQIREQAEHAFSEFRVFLRNTSVRGEITHARLHSIRRAMFVLPSCRPARRKLLMLDTEGAPVHSTEQDCLARDTAHLRALDEEEHAAEKGTSAVFLRSAPAPPLEHFAAALVRPLSSICAKALGNRHSCMRRVE
jgi:hypothetical protein